MSSECVIYNSSYKRVVDFSFNSSYRQLHVRYCWRSSWSWIKFLWIFLEVKEITLLSRLYVKVNVIDYLEVTFNYHVTYWKHVLYSAITSCILILVFMYIYFTVKYYSRAILVS